MVRNRPAPASQTRLDVQRLRWADSLPLVHALMPYGSKGMRGLVPRNAPLVMEIELIELRDSN